MLSTVKPSLLVQFKKKSKKNSQYRYPPSKIRSKRTFSMFTDSLATMNAYNDPLNPMSPLYMFNPTSPLNPNRIRDELKPMPIIDPRTKIPTTMPKIGDKSFKLSPLDDLLIKEFEQNNKRV